MGEGPKKQQISVGLLAHVGASRREPHLNSFIPGSKTGDSLCSASENLFQTFLNK